MFAIQQGACGCSNRLERLIFHLNPVPICFREHTNPAQNRNCPLFAWLRPRNPSRRFLDPNQQQLVQTRHCKGHTARMEMQMKANVPDVRRVQVCVQHPSNDAIREHLSVSNGKNVTAHEQQTLL